MADITREIVQGYLAVFDSYVIQSSSLKQQMEELKERMLSFAAVNSDPVVFYAKFAESNLQEEYSALITKVAMASMGNADEDGNVIDYSDTPPATPMCVREFVEQYRSSYNEVKKAGYRKRGEAAYESIFAVADRTEDMLEAQIIFEKEGLLWKIANEDGLDIFEPVLEALDPLQPAQTAAIRKQVDIYREAQGSEELFYSLERAELDKLTIVRQETSRITLIAQLAYLLLGYAASKLNTQLTGGQGEEGHQSLRKMVSLRRALRRTLTLLKDDLGLSFEALLGDEGLKIWLLSPQNADELGRVKEALNPQNYNVYKELVHNEILSEISIPELLKQESGAMLWYGFEGQARKEFNKKASEAACQLNAHLTYFHYKDKLNQAMGSQSSKDYIPVVSNKIND